MLAIEGFVLGLFETGIGIEQYKQHVRDFLISCKEFSVEDNKELYLEEVEAQEQMLADQQLQYRQSVPGLTPSDLIDDDL